MNYLLFILAAVFVNNYILSQFLGICPFLGVSKKVETAAGMGVAVIFVMTLASIATYFIYSFILVKLNISYLYNIAFILVIAALVQFVEMFIISRIRSHAGMVVSSSRPWTAPESMAKDSILSFR